MLFNSLLVAASNKIEAAQDPRSEAYPVGSRGSFVVFTICTRLQRRGRIWSARLVYVGAISRPRRADQIRPLHWCYEDLWINAMAWPFICMCWCVL